MANFSASGSTGKQMIISLRGLSHEVCVAATQTDYWQHLIKKSNISITSSGNYIPVELETFCNDEEEPRLQLIIKSQHEQDNKQFDVICTRIRKDLISFKMNDRPICIPGNHQLLVFGSLFNSLPTDIFDTERYLLGQQNCNIERIRNSLACSISVDTSISRRYRFIIHHDKEAIMDLAAIQIQALVREAQNRYLITYATKVGRILIGPMERMDIFISSSNLDAFPSFEPTIKRKCTEHEQQQPTTSGEELNRFIKVSIILMNLGQPIIDSDQSDDETILDEKREERREQVELLISICERMQVQTPKNKIAKAHEDSCPIKSYFRNTCTLKAISNESEISIELVERGMDFAYIS